MRTLPALSLLGLLVAALPAAARFGMPEPLTPRGRIMESIYSQIFVAGTLVFILVFVLLVWVLWRYRENSGHGRATHEMERHSAKLEALWIIVPLIIVLWVGWISFVGLKELDHPYDPQEADLEVGIVGSQWNWEAKYGDVSVFADPDASTGKVAAKNHFLVPADTVVRFNVTAIDVIHAWHMMDENRVTVALVDANPSGPHKYNTFTATLPEGIYPVQCREMCLNPGHGYMRATVEAVPPAAFAFWLEGKELAAGAELVHDVKLEVGGAPVSGEAIILPGTLVRADITNMGDQAITVDVDGNDAATIAAGQRAWYAFTATGSNHTLNVGPGAMTFQVQAADKIHDVKLGAFVFEPADLEPLDTGKTYLLRLENVHNTVHNLFIGEYQGEVQAQSATINAGESTSFVFTPSKAGTFDIWCNVPGHYEAGMKGSVTIS